jgi:hypothetical protein
MENQKITYKNKVIGELRPDHVYITQRTSKHFFVKFKGFGISASILKELKDKGCTKITLIYNRTDGTQAIYETYPNKFYELGEIWRDDENDYQRILAVKDFNMSQLHLKADKQGLLGSNQRQLSEI